MSLPRRNKVSAPIFVAGVVALAATMILIKLFTAEVRYSDDPTVQVIVRALPSLVSQIRVADDADLTGAHVILTDENELVGQSAYRAITSFGWLFGCAMLTGAALWYVRGRRAR